MKGDDFIIALYLPVCELYQAFVQRHRSSRPLRRRGFAPARTNGEVITIEPRGEHDRQHYRRDLPPRSLKESL